MLAKANPAKVKLIFKLLACHLDLLISNSDSGIKLGFSTVSLMILLISSSLVVQLIIASWKMQINNRYAGLFTLNFLSKMRIATAILLESMY